VIRRLPDNLRGAAFMTLAMAGFAVEDMLLKSAGRGLPVGQILMLFGAGGAALFALWARLGGERLLVPAMAAPAVLARAAFEALGRLGYTLAIVLTPLSSASAILQAAPLVVVAGAALVFGERVGPRRWAAVGFGFLGVLLILRPGLDAFQPASVLALLGMVGFAARDLATRAARGLSTAQFGVLGFLVMVPVGAGLLALTGGAVRPTPGALAGIGAATLVGVGAYAALTRAMRTGEVSVVTPFRYTRLLFGLGLGVAVFGERPDAATLAGSAMVLAAGLDTFLRERRRPGADSG
jgi:drug/metabolite transporter (DMT)-like permease